MRKSILIYLCFVLGMSMSFGQNRGKAQKNYMKAEEAIQQRQIGEAKIFLEKSIAADTTFGDSFYLLAYLNILERDYQKSRALYKRLMLCCDKEPKFALAHLSLAQYEWSEGNYAKAKQFCLSYLDFRPSSKEYKEKRIANKIIASCDYAMANMQHELPYSPVSLGDSVNKLDQQYFPAITATGNELYFTARTYKSDENIYRSEKIDGEWASPEIVRELSTKFNEGTCTISADGSFMIFTSCESTRELPGYGSCDLFMAKKVGDHWLKPKNLGPHINSRDWESQPSLSADGRTLYFVSDRKGGIGKKDIWVSHLVDGAWTTAKNLGDVVNTMEDDISPYIHSNGKTLYFSSEGHLGFGGLDIFKTDQKSPALWTKPVNIGYPLNDHRDQVSLIVSADGSKGYFSKEILAPDGKRSSKIVTFDVPEEVQPDALSSYLEGVVYDAVTKAPLKAELELKRLESDETESRVMSDSESGKYLIVLNQDEEYALFISRPGYLYQSLTFDMHNAGVDGKTLDIFLERIEKGTNITLNNIFFESNKYQLKNKSAAELEQILEFMKRNPDVAVEIAGHTDNIGTIEYNKDLSQKRAQAVVNYLISNDINASRLKAIGYGESQPISSNKTEEGRQENRRIEFIIL
ncbi:OmpA family protein [Flammeovirga agarivorans]|uniref:OmpA family protein n=1 Tax=Flammeovirga agarivorans TaxID=2726742 RepID=A0A7X8SL57_9BACT|nr:OmpA family protein [Flammeovirga agarivorans]NLR92256.1 OmpA family protein [Flammeovirga agarivorans]